jgi:membrane associated rhomboid family serine protease
MIKPCIVFAVLAALAYMFVEPQDAQPAFHHASKRSADHRSPFFARSIDVRSSTRLHIAVDILNPTGAYFALCVVPPGQKLPAYQRKRACGGRPEFQMHTLDHDVAERGIVNPVFEDAAVTLDWYSNASHTAGVYSVEWELHNAVSAANFEAVVRANTFYDISRHVDGALHYPLQAARWLLNSFTTAYSFVRPASCRAAAKSSLNVNIVGSCKSFLSSIDSKLLVICQALSGGHIALVLIVLLNILLYLPSIADEKWWALRSGRPSWRTLFTYQFAHANLQHIAGNMLTLLFVGTEVSESLNCDHILFVSFYLLCGLCGGLFAVLLSPPNTSTVGASGSVSGMIVALSVLRPNSAVTILGDVNASNPLMLLAVTLLADLKRLNVSWQVMPLRPSPASIVCRMRVSARAGAPRRRYRGVCFGSFASCGAASAGLKLPPPPRVCVQHGVPTLL